VLFARPVAGGPERDPTLPLAFEVRFLNFTTGKHETLNRFEMRGGYGPSVSPDRKTILYSGRPISPGDDLMLIRNFR
jgi:hypothetical protein